MDHLDLFGDLRDTLNLHRENFQTFCWKNEEYKQVNKEEERLGAIIRDKIEDHALYMQWEEKMSHRLSIEDGYTYWQGISDAVLLLKMMGVVS